MDNFNSSSFFSIAGLGFCRILTDNTDKNCIQVLFQDIRRCKYTHSDLVICIVPFFVLKTQSVISHISTTLFSVLWVIEQTDRKYNDFDLMLIHVVIFLVVWGGALWPGG